MDLHLTRQLMKTTTNGLLSVIAVCLVLITLRLYGVGFVATANAESEATSSSTLEVRLCGQHTYEGGILPKWLPVKVDEYGKLLVSN